MRLAISAATASGTAIVVAVAVAILDLYLTGHGYGSIRKEIAGVQLSIGDIVLLLAALSAGVLIWCLLPRKSSSS
jgi:hypothetical protein